MEHPPFPPVDAYISVTHYGNKIHGNMSLRESNTELTSFKEGDLVKRALEAGTIGYLLKDVSAEEVVQAIRTTHAGRATLSLSLLVTSPTWRRKKSPCRWM